MKQEQITLKKELAQVLPLFSVLVIVLFGLSCFVIGVLETIVIFSILGCYMLFHIIALYIFSKSLHGPN